jgi:hypothetical protein
MDIPPPDLPSDFNLDEWINGTCGLTKPARIYQRGDLIAKLDRLDEEIEAAKVVAKGDRGINDKSPEQLRKEWDTVAEELASTALLVHVQDRTQERRRGIRDRMVKEGMKLSDENDTDTILLHAVADAIVKVETPDGRIKELPDGFPPNKLRDIRDRLGDAALLPLMIAFNEVTQQAPSVAAPLSRRSSSGRGGVT